MTLTATPPEFKGLAIQYDPKAQPFFEALVMENLRQLKGLKSGAALLNAIADATPTVRSDFPAGANVLIQPPISRTWAAPGVSHRDGHLIDATKYATFQAGQGQMVPSMGAKTQTQPVNAAASCSGGSVCWLFFSNVEIRSGAGEWLVPYITMGHELIHALRALKGHSKPVGDRTEEYETTGIKGHTYAITENDLRADAGMPLRTKYFAND